MIMPWTKISRLDVDEEQLHSVARLLTRKKIAKIEKMPQHGAPETAPEI